MAPDEAAIVPLARPELLVRAAEQTDWDIIIIGGGATGLGAAVDAASRGCRTLLLEAHDFAKGTSSRSTKLVHGGVRYLEQGRIGLVREALVERARMLRNAPRWVKPLSFVVPVYTRWDKLKLRVGLTAYSLLAGRFGLGPARVLSVEETIEALPAVKRDGLQGGVAYMDAQFDDAALAVALAQTVYDQGGMALNYVPVSGLRLEDGRVSGVNAHDLITGRELAFSAKAVINAAGVWVDGVRRMAQADVVPMVSPSQGVHLVVGAEWLPGRQAMLVPETEDGRVLFMIPWLGKVLLGTTDTPLDQLPIEPLAHEAEIDFILREAAQCLERAPTRDDVLSVFAGLRPLISADPEATTSELSREHVIRVEHQTLVTIAGGKWTTYRQMAEEVVDEALKAAGMPPRECKTQALALHSAWHEAGEALHPRLDLSEAQVRHAVRKQFALTVEDVLARRHRALFLDAAAAIAIAPEVARIMADELDRDAAWIAAQVEAFIITAEGYRCAPATPPGA